MFNYTDSNFQTQSLPIFNARENPFQSHDQQRWFLGHSDQVRVIVKDQHWNNDTSVASRISEVCFATNKPQQQMVLNLTNDCPEAESSSKDENIAASFERMERAVRWKTKLIEQNDRKSSKSILWKEDLIKIDRQTISNNSVVIVPPHECIFNSKKPTDYLPLISNNVRKSAPFDKDDQARRKKQRINLINTPADRRGGKDNEAKEINDKAKVKRQLFAPKNTKSTLKQRLMSKLQRIFSTRRIDTPVKEEGNHSPQFSLLNRASTLQASSFSCSSSPIDMLAFRGQTCDRSTSAYASKRRAQRINQIEQSTTRNILARVAEKLDQNGTELNDNRDYRTAPKTVKYESHSTEFPSNASDIYIKLSDCQAACRRWTAKDRKRNQLDRFPSSPRPHHRHGKTKRPVCYRNFPLSLNALSKFNNIRREYFLDSTDYQLSNRMESEEDIQTKTSEDTRKASFMKMHSNAKVHHSFIRFGTVSADFVDGSNGPVVYLRQGDAKTEEQIYLYRRISNDQLDFRDEREQSQHIVKLLSESVINSIEVDDEASVQSVFKQFSNSILASAHMLRADHECDIRSNLVSSVLDASVAGILYQSPLQATVIVDMIPAYMVTLINCRTRALMIQAEILPSIFSKSDAAHLWQRQSLLNVTLIDEISDGQADQRVILNENVRDHPDISDGINNRTDQFDQDSNNKQNSVNRHPSSGRVFELPPPINLLISEEKISTLNDKADNQHIIPSIPWNSTDRQSQREELDLQSITVKRTNNEDAIHDFEFSSIGFISEHINAQSVEEILRDHESTFSAENFPTSTSSRMKKDQSVESAGRISAETKIFPDNNRKQQDPTKRSLSLGKMSHSLIESDEVSTANANTEYLSMEGETSSIISEGNHVTEENAHHKSISLKKSSSLDEQHITIPRCLQLCDSFKQTIHRNSDRLLSTTTFPKHSAAKIHTKASPTQLKSEGHSSDSKKSPSSGESFSETNNSSDNTDLQSAFTSLESLSIQSDSGMQKSDKEKQSIEKLGISRIMEIPRKLIDNVVADDHLNSVPKERKYYVQSQYSDDQEEKFSISPSSPIRRKPTKRKKKNKRTVIRTKYTRRRKFIRPSWVSVYKTPGRNNYPLYKPTNRTACALEQPNDPCQMFDIHTQFQRLNCRPYGYICTPLPPCFCVKSVHRC